MTQHASNPFSEFCEEYEDDRPTWPSPGSSKLIVIDKCEALFFSAVWTIIASVNGKTIAMSSESVKPHSDPFIRQWSRQMIRKNYSQLRAIGVDAEDEYVKLGGDLADLEK